VTPSSTILPIGSLDWKRNNREALSGIPSLQTPNPPRVSPIVVLLVDDQPIVGESIRRLLEPEKEIQFHYCSDPTQALKMAEAVSPTVILQDLIMSEMDGLLLVRFFRAKNSPTRDIPLIVLSKNDEPATKAKAFAWGANDYLVKMPDKQELIARIRYHSKAYHNFLERDRAYADMERSLRHLELERAKSDHLLLNIFPAQIVERLKKGERAIADIFPHVSVLFADIVGFTKLSALVSPRELLGTINVIFSAFDQLVDFYDLEKIKTIGDAYMIVSGLPTERSDHAEAIANIALDMQSQLNEIVQMAVEHIDRDIQKNFSIRIGIHSGPVIAGIVGKRKFLYDLWGDTVNTASRMESHGAPHRIHVSEATYDLLGNQYRFEARGEIDIKGKGLMKTYFLIGKNPGHL
jgi:adenylate cyclase